MIYFPEKVLVLMFKQVPSVRVSLHRPIWSSVWRCVIQEDTASRQQCSRRSVLPMMYEEKSEFADKGSRPAVLSIVRGCLSIVYQTDSFLLVSDVFIRLKMGKPVYTVLESCNKL